MPNIFLSYRRSDAPAAAGRICDNLRTAFPRDKLFWDMDGINAGADFRESICESLTQSDVLISVIGRNWQVERLSDVDDVVRMEIEESLKKGLHVIPVLVEGASMPGSGDVPDSIQPLVFKQARPVRPDPDFRYDFHCLVDDLKFIDEPTIDEHLRYLRQLLISARSEREFKEGLYRLESLVDRHRDHIDARLLMDSFQAALRSTTTHGRSQIGTSEWHDLSTAESHTFQFGTSRKIAAGFVGLLLFLTSAAAFWLNHERRQAVSAYQRAAIETQLASKEAQLADERLQAGRMMLVASEEARGSLAKRLNQTASELKAADRALKKLDDLEAALEREQNAKKEAEKHLQKVQEDRNELLLRVLKLQRELGDTPVKAPVP